VIDRDTRNLVRERAKFSCEFCGLAESYSPVAKLQIEHIRPKKHGGTDNAENLALACIDCNLRKGSNLTGIDPQTDAITELFNPRIQKWNDHFAWQGLRIDGLTDVGRTTVEVMGLNTDDRLQVRLATRR